MTEAAGDRDEGHTFAVRSQSRSDPDPGIGRDYAGRVAGAGETNRCSRPEPQESVHQVGPLGMQERALGLAEIGNSGFVHRVVLRVQVCDRFTCCARVALLSPKPGSRLWRSRLESGEGLTVEAVIEVVIEAQVLLIVDAMIEL